MENKVKVTAHPETGVVFTPNEGVSKDGKQYGWIRVKSKQRSINNGFLSLQKRSAIVGMLVSDYEEDKNYLKKDALIPGKIIYKDSLEEKPGFRPLMRPDSETGELIAITCNNKQVYRKVEYTEDLNSFDERVTYDIAGEPQGEEEAISLTEETEEVSSE